MAYILSGNIPPGYDCTCPPPTFYVNAQGDEWIEQDIEPTCKEHGAAQ